MATTAASLVQQLRHFSRDWPDLDKATASIASGATSISVADTTKYAINAAIELDSEAFLVTALTSATVLAVRPAMFGTAAATHASGAGILIRPKFLAVELLEALNSAMEACYPRIYQEVLDTSLTVTSGVYEYTVPNMPGTYGGDSIPIPRLHTVEIQDASTVPYTALRSWNVKRGATPKLKLTYLEAGGSVLRLHGYGPFPDLALADSLSTQWPRNFVRPLVEMAGSVLAASGELGRVRIDVGARDDREAANRPGSSMNAANALEARFLRRLANVALAPMQPHIVTHE